MKDEKNADVRDAANDRCVAVYGTLRRGCANDITRLEPPPEFVGIARVAGTMHHLGRYPGVVLGGDTMILVEVYRVSAALERRLDEIESEYPAQADEYAKRELNLRVTTERGDGDVDAACFIYEINPAYVVGRPVLTLGDWLLEA